LVAIIGNKGNGKSALAETIALVGNTRQWGHFSFLTGTKFRQAATNKAGDFQGAIIWCDQTESSRRLDAAVDPSEPERVQFIPQNFLEQICNEVPRGAETDFDREIQRVIFAHVDRTARLGEDTLAGLIAVKTRAAEDELAERRADLRGLNEQIVDHERRTSEVHRQELRTAYLERRRALADLKRARPIPVAEPVGGAGPKAAAMDEARARHSDLLAEENAIRQTLDRTNRDLAMLENFATALGTFERGYERLRGEYSDSLAATGLDLDEVLSLKVDRGLVDTRRTELRTQHATLEAELDPNNPTSLASRIIAAVSRMEELQVELDAPEQAYRAYIAAHEEGHRQRAALIGSRTEPGTALYYRAALHALRDIPERLAHLRALRRERTREMHERLRGLVDEYRSLYRPTQSFVNEQAVSKEANLRFSAGLVDCGLEPGFLDFIDRRMASGFSGPESEGMVRELLAATDLDDPDQTVQLADAIHDRLHHATRGGDWVEDLSGFTRKGKDIVALYDFLYGLNYLEPRYTLNVGEKHLHELSPGEKGTLLLIFYLLVDPNDAPLIIDQPEDNLDNQTVYKVLIPCIRRARARRQIILVTHNPNLAVVCDADQVIAARIEKGHGNRAVYEAGAIENPLINRRIVDILEGTRPAFDNRGSKYQPER
jgi:energy-coupling factor transporter ATP-binding protein EcfA2